MRSQFPHIGACASNLPLISPYNLLLALSWEIGTLTEALLEYSWPKLSVFNPYGSIPPARELFTFDCPTDVINIATT